MFPESGVVTLSMGLTAKITLSMLIAVFIVLGLLLIASYGNPGERVVYVVGDTCGYELATRLSSYPGLRGSIVNVNEVEMTRPNIGRDTLVVFIYTNASSIGSYRSRLLEWQEILSSHLVVSTDIVQNITGARNVILNDDIWSYCMYGDTESFNRVLGTIQNVLYQYSPPRGEIPLVSLALFTSAIILGIATYFDELSNAFKGLIGRALSFVAIFAMFLGLRIDRSKIFEHPTRQEIYRYLLENGDVSFSDLMNNLKCSRATLEWHLSLLIRAGIIEEYRRGKVRYYRLINKTYK